MKKTAALTQRSLDACRENLEDDGIEKDASEEESEEEEES